MKKTIFLLLTLAIPVSIFLFLKFFGTNTFEVPCLFDEGIPDCVDSSSPHIVPVVEYIGGEAKNLISSDLNGFLVFGVLYGTDLENNEDKMRELVRIQDAFYEVGSPHFVLFPHEELGDIRGLMELCTEYGMEQKNYSLVNLKEEKLMEFLRCGIALIDNVNSEFDNLVLVDPEKRIRGIYNSKDIEQTDKLILELKILKQNM